ncbi:MAG: hypothetical protein IT355_14785 [Gemmatimonadaceae bacterium]|nr:hypothetical protein [Gemmatimonadaceae bacterium]
MMIARLVRSAAVLLPALLMAAPQARAQASTVAVAYTPLLVGNPTGADFVAGRVVAGFATITVGVCGRGTCQVRMRVTASTGSTALRYVVSAATPALASCASTVTTAAAGTTVLSVPAGATATARVYFCYNLSWTASPPASYAPVVTFQLRNGL